MSRTQWTLAGLLVLQLVLLLGIHAPSSGDAAAGGPHPLLPVMESVTPTRIQITEGEEGKSVVLKRKGEAWALEDAGGYPADPETVDRLLDDLEALKVRRPVVSSSRYHAALKVTEDDHERRVRLWEDASDDPKVDLFLGSSPNYRISHARLGGDDRVYELRGLNSYDLRADATSWIKKKFLDIPFDDVTGLKLRNRHGQFELERQEGEWKIISPAGSSTEGFDPSKVDSLVRSLASLWLSEPVGPVDGTAHGFDEPAATVEIAYNVGAAVGEDDEEPAAEEGEEVAQTEGAPGEGAVTEAEAGDEPAAPQARIEVTTLRIGKEVEDGEGKRYASRSGFDYSVILSKYDAEKATDKKLADLYEDE